MSQDEKPRMEPVAAWHKWRTSMMIPDAQESETERGCFIAGYLAALAHPSERSEREGLSAVLDQARQSETYRDEALRLEREGVINEAVAAIEALVQNALARGGMATVQHYQQCQSVVRALAKPQS